MAKAQDIKRRIRSVRNTMTVTRAMKMVASAKLRRAQQRMSSARPYAEQMRTLLQSLSARTDSEAHPLLQQHGSEHIEMVVMTADRGLCGAFNSGIVRTAEAFARVQDDRQVAVSTIGKKGRDYFARRRAITRQWTDVFRVVEYEAAKEIADDMMQRFVAREFDAVYLIYNEFKSAIQTTPRVRQILPIEPAELDAGDTADEYIYEPSAQDLLETLLPHYVRTQVFQAMLESAAAEHAARMAAMESASNNAQELIESLTLTMNRVRQASITTEIIEVVSGAEALG